MSQYDTPEWFPFYAYAFLGDELVQAMTLEQIGAYTLLLISQWINGSIPADIPSLARMLRGRTTAEMEILWQGVGPCFTPTEDGRLVQKRLAAEREKAIRRLLGNRRGGKSRQEQAKSGQTQVEDRSTLGRPLCNVMSSSKEETTSKRERLYAQWREFTTLYPPARLDEERACMAFNSRDEESDAILAGLRLAVTSEEWTKDGGKYAPMASRFISEGRYKDAARLTQPKADTPPPSTMDPETRRRIAEAQRG